MVRKASHDWSVVGGSALGGRHVFSGAPNQDSWKSGSVDHRGDRFVIMAVADGHGGARYVRSDIGSKLAVETAVEVVTDAIGEGLFDLPRRRLDREVRRLLPQRLVSGWTNRCLSHLGRNPFTPEEEARARSPLDGDPLLSYGSTLLVSVLNSNGCVVLQLGDGDTLISGDDAVLVQALPADDRLTGGETTSLCLPTAASDFRVAVVDDPPPTLVLLASDGYGVAFADPAWRQTVVDDLLGLLGRNGMESVSASLPGWLSDSAEVGGDDVTVVVAHRELAGRPKAISRRQATLALTGACALLVGVLAGWGMARGFAGNDQPDGLTPGTSVSVPATDPFASSSTMEDSRAETTVDNTEITRPPDTTDIPTSTTVAGGGVIGEGSDGGQFAWIVGADGALVKFTANLTDPDAMRSEVVDIDPNVLVFAFDRQWGLDDGMLISDGEELDLGISFGGVEYEGGLLWLLSEEGDWLVAYHPDPLFCEMYPVSSPAPSLDDDGEFEPKECTIQP